MPATLRLETGTDQFAQAAGAASIEEAGRIHRAISRFNLAPIGRWAGGQSELVVAVNSPSSRRRSGGWYQFRGETPSSGYEISLIYPSDFDATAVGRVAGHEVGHAVLDYFNRTLSRFNIFNKILSFEVAAFHEAFADIMVMLADLLDPSTVRREVDNSGIIRAGGTLDTFGGDSAQFGTAILARPRQKSGSHRYGDFADNAGVISGANHSEHDASLVVTGFMFDLVRALVGQRFQDLKRTGRTDDEAKVDAASYVAVDFGQLLLMAVSECPPVPNYFAMMGHYLVRCANTRSESPHGGPSWNYVVSITQALNLRGIPIISGADLVGSNQLVRLWEPIHSSNLWNNDEVEKLLSDPALHLETGGAHRFRGSDRLIMDQPTRQGLKDARITLDAKIHPSLDGVVADTIHSIDILELKMPRAGESRYWAPSGDPTTGGLDLDRFTELERVYITSLVQSGRIDYQDEETPANTGGVFTFQVDRSSIPPILIRRGFSD